MAHSSPAMFHQFLLIESDQKQAEKIRDALGGNSNLRMHILPDVVTAIRFLAKRDGFIHAPTPDLILIDLELPYFSGTALLEERRRRPEWNTIPVVVFTYSVEDRLECLARGADGHVVKPTEPSGWRRILDEVLLRHLSLTST